jgi:hypothetical protein
MLVEWFVLLLLATVLASALGYAGVAASMALFIKVALLFIAVIGLGAGAAFLLQGGLARKHPSGPHGAH